VRDLYIGCRFRQCHALLPPLFARLPQEDYNAAQVRRCRQRDRPIRVISIAGRPQTL
jgi:hypothetical protein